MLPLNALVRFVCVCCVMLYGLCFVFCPAVAECVLFWLDLFVCFVCGLLRDVVCLLLACV